MQSKILERCMEEEKEISEQDQGNKFKLEYYLLENETDDSDQIKVTYGIEIVKRMNDGSTDSVQFTDVYSDREKVRNLVRILAANDVTPVSLPYILDDLLCM